VRLLVVCCCALGMFLATWSWSAASPLATARVTPAGPSTMHDVVTPLAGSSTELVFARQVHLSEDASTLGAGTGVGQAGGTSTVYAQSQSGAAVSLGAFPAGVTGQIGGWSTAGTLVAAGAYGYDYPTTHTVYVWRLPSARRYTVRLTSRDRYLTVAAQGVVYATPAGAIKLRSLDGTTVVLRKQPLGSIGVDELVFGVAGPKGVVVTATGHPAIYLPFDASEPVVTLDSAGSQVAPVCVQASATYAACSYEDSEGGYYSPGEPVLVPLDGSAATRPDLHGDDDSDIDDAALLGNSTLVYWVDGKVRAALPGSTASKASGLPGGQGIDLVGALGRVYEASSTASALKALNQGGTVTTAVPPRRSAVSVDAFDLTASKVVYGDDQQVATRSGDDESVLARTISSTGRGLRLGKPRLLSHGTQNVSGNFVAASSTVEVYATDTVPFYGSLQVTLHVSFKHHLHAIPHVNGDSFIQVSGDKVLYQPAGEAMVYDARTGHTRTVARTADPAASAISGHYVAYATDHGGIYRKNLSTGHTVQLAPPLKNDGGGVQLSVYAAGPWVGWTAQPLQYELGRAENFIRNATTMTPAIRLPHTLYSLTRAGAILASAKATADDEQAFYDLSDGVQQPKISTWLRHYSGAVTVLLSRRRYTAGPQITNHVLAWAGQDGELKARTFR
jgi:hypothetical protein